VRDTEDAALVSEAINRAEERPVEGIGAVCEEIVIVPTSIRSNDATPFEPEVKMRDAERETADMG
jgi:hypothetical protein